jgi:hypothetical protein
MAKLALTDVSNLLGSPTSAANTINANNALIETAIENTLSRDGSTPNQMNAQIDMNTHEIINVGAPAGSDSAVRWIDLVNYLKVNSTTVIPALTGNAGKYLSTDGSTMFWRLPTDQVVNVMNYGAIGDGVADDTAAFTAAWNAALSISAVSPAKIYIPNGSYLITSALPVLTGRITIEGANPLATKIYLNGNFTLLKVQGIGSRAGWTIFNRFSVICSNMTSAYAVALDWCQNVIFNEFHLVTPFNGISIRQSGNIAFVNTMVDTVTGTFGVYAYGTSTPRNGENDQIDVIMFYNTIIQSNYVSGGPANSTTCLALDGRVHSVQFDGLKLLSAGKGIITVNTPGLIKALAPRFLVGSGLEIEAMYIACVDFEWVTDVNLGWLFAAGAHGDGVYLGPNVGTVTINSASINSNYLCGINVDGAAMVTVNNAVIYNNSLQAGGTKSGISVKGASKFSGNGGVWGQHPGIDPYADPQKFGIELDGTFSGTILLNGVRIQGNAVGSLYDNGTSAVGSSVKNCPGYNPRGAVLNTVGASGYVYTAGLTTEYVTIYGGSGVVCTVDGVALINTTPGSFALPPRKSVTITYTTIPTMAIVRD